MAENEEMKNNRNILDFQDPGPLPQELMSVPGFVNELKDYTLATAPRPNEPLAFAGALAMLAHLGGRTYRDVRGVRTCLYLAALAPSGMGKEEPREVNKRLAAEAGLLDSLPDSVTSGQALEDAVGDHPSLLMQSDEADSLLAALRGSNGRASCLHDMILKVYGEAKGLHAMRLKAGDVKVRNVVNPHLTLFATGIPKFCYSAMTSRALQDGLLGRCLFIDTDEFRPLGKMPQLPLPTSVVETAKAFAAREKQIADTGVIEPVVVPDTPEAERMIADLGNTYDTITKRLMDSGLEASAALYVRAAEKVMKLALLWSLSDNPENPQITAAGVSWSKQLTNHLTQRMLYLAQFYVAEGRFDSMKKSVLGALAQAGGSLDRTTLLRKMGYSAQTLQKIILTLHMCDLIEEETIGRRKVVYTLKAA